MSNIPSSNIAIRGPEQSSIYRDCHTPEIDIVLQPQEGKQYYEVDQITYSVTSRVRVEGTSADTRAEIIEQSEKIATKTLVVDQLLVGSTVRLDINTDEVFNEVNWRKERIESLRVKRPGENLHEDQRELSTFKYTGRVRHLYNVIVEGLERFK